MQKDTVRLALALDCARQLRMCAWVQLRGAVQPRCRRPDTVVRLAGLAGLAMQRTGEARALHASLRLHLPGKRSLHPCGQRSVRQSQRHVIGSAAADRACGKYVSE
jgi:hypothetical protein